VESEAEDPGAKTKIDQGVEAMEGQEEEKTDLLAEEEAHQAGMIDTVQEEAHQAGMIDTVQE